MARQSGGDWDVVVLGGGIAGLWILDRLREAGYNAALLERGELGGGQSLASQGIIHGGLKFVLRDDEGLTLKDLAAMPQRWRASLEGRVGPDLSRVRILSPEVLFWVPPHTGVGGRLLAGAAQTSLRSVTRSIPRPDWPRPFRHDGGGGALFAGDEPVLDVASVMETLLARNRVVVRRLPQSELAWSDGALRCGDFALRTRCIVAAAGAGNEALRAVLGMPDVACQRRPLRQILIGGLAEPVFAHCAGASDKPLATVTSYADGAGGWTWYVGGGIAEEGAGMASESAIGMAQQRLQGYFPGVDFSNARWSSLEIDRAEFAGRDGRSGATAIVEHGPVLMVWPTKLALTPHLADQVLERVSMRLGGAHGTVAPAPSTALSALPQPDMALAPWRRVSAWN